MREFRDKECWSDLFSEQTTLNPSSYQIISNRDTATIFWSIVSLNIDIVVKCHRCYWRL